MTTTLTFETGASISLTADPLGSFAFEVNESKVELSSQQPLAKTITFGIETTFLDVYGGPPGPVGPVGPAGAAGPQGVPGPLSDLRTYPFNVANPALMWTIPHNLNRYPSVTIVDTAGDTIAGEVQYVSAQTLTIMFGLPIAGTALLN